MATEVIRYVNTASTAGGDGTTNGTAGSNRAYASLDGAVQGQAAIRPNLVSNDEFLRILCCGTAADTTVVQVNGFTTDATRYISIEGNPTDPNGRHAGVYSTSKYRLEVAHSETCMRTYVNFTRYLGLQIANTSTGIGLTFRHKEANGGSILLDGCIVKAAANFALSDENRAVDGVFAVRNNIFYNSQRAMDLYGRPNDNWSIHNNTAVDCSEIGYTLRPNGTGDTYSIRNNIAFNCVDDWFFSGTGSSQTITNNAYSQGADPGTSGQDISASAGSAVFNDYSGDDFHLKAGSPVIGFGVDLSGTFTNDIDNATRVAPWDIGADEFAGVVAAVITPLAPPVPRLFNMQRGRF